MHKQDEINGSIKHFIFRNFSSDLPHYLVGILKKKHIQNYRQVCDLKLKVRFSLFYYFVFNLFAGSFETAYFHGNYVPL